MADNTAIEWTDATWNPITGCSVVSPGCTNCYAMKLAGTRLKHHPTRQGLTRDSKAGPVWTGEVRINEGTLDQPLRWMRPRKIFVCAHGDLLHESVPDAWIDRVFAVMAVSYRHTYQVLTKRSARMRAYLSDPRTADRIWHLVDTALPNPGRYLNKVGAQYRGRDWPLRNVWLGVSAEDQARADERIPDLLATPAAVRWLSAEPLLGPIDLETSKGGTLWIGGQRGCSGTHRGIGTPECPREPHHHHDDRCQPGLDWVVVGGESGPDARPMHPGWVRDFRDQCAAAEVAFLFKQWGNWIAEGQTFQGYVRPAAHSRRWVHPIDGDNRYSQQSAAVYPVGKKAAGRLLDGVLHDAFPEVR